MRYLKFFVPFYLGIFCVTTSVAQTPIDTLVNEKGEEIVVFSDRSEMKLEDMPFNGVMNRKLQKYLASKDFNKVQKWENDVCFTSTDSYGITHYNDTLKLALDVAGPFVMPVSGIMTSAYKYRWRHYHKGIDLAVHMGEPILAAWDGKVRYAQYNRGGYGYLVILRHKNGLETLYAHMSKLNVLPNQDVKAGEVIGFGGSTGHSTGPHLHFEIRFFDAPINPEEIIDVQAKELKKHELLVYSDVFRPGALPTDRIETEPNHQDVYSNNATESITHVVKAPTRTSTVAYYRVKSGDNLSSIAARHNTTVSKLCKLNRISANSTLQLGRRLRVR